MKPNAVTDSTFDAAVLRASEPVLVDFWAEWCGPCRMIGPFLEDLATDMAGKLTVAKVNIDENPQTPMKYGVRGIPTMILFKDGQVAATKIGALPKSKLYEWVESLLESRSVVQPGGGNRATQCRAMSSRRQTQTWLWARVCWIKRISALARPGWPVRRMCKPTDIIRGRSAASSESRSKLSGRKAKKSSPEAKTPRPNFESLVVS